MKIRYSFLAGLLFASITFIYLVITSRLDIAIVVSIFIVCVSPFIFYFKMFSNTDFDGDFQKIEKNSLIYSGLSNHFKDRIAVGGTLYLFNDRLIFQTNLINFIKRYEQIIFLNQILEIDDTFSSCSISNALLIKTRDNGVEKFVVYKREIWKEQIEKLIAKHN